MKKIFLVLLVLALVACFESTPTQASEKVKQMEKLMDEGKLPVYLNRSTPEDLLDYMGRTWDKMERGTGDLRLYKYRFTDGSSLVFAMKPAGNQTGLVLSHFTDER